MAIRIKQGDEYSLPVLIRLNGEPVDVSEVAEVEFTLGNGVRKTFPQEVQYNSADGCFYLPLTQEETFAFPANGSVTLDIRVKFAGGNVIGVQRMESIAVADASSEVIL